MSKYFEFTPKSINVREDGPAESDPIVARITLEEFLRVFGPKPTEAVPTPTGGLTGLSADLKAKIGRWVTSELPTNSGMMAMACRRDLEEIVDAAIVAASKPRPEIVCLCGSSRFFQAYRAANYRLTMAGKIVLSIGFFPSPDAQAHGEHVGCTPEQKVALDVLHCRKIDLADSVYVLDIGGYVGDSTRREIAHATAAGKPIAYASADAEFLAFLDSISSPDTTPTGGEGGAE